jgi:hypothetical protein
MLSLVNPEQVDTLSFEKQELLNKIIASGLNSLTGYMHQPNAPEHQLLQSFINQSFDKIMPCWHLLNDQIKFFIFKAHLKDFESYIQQKASQNIL